MAHRLPRLSGLSGWLLFALATFARGDAPDYLAVVRGYADAMIDRGRDDYGDQSSPLFAAALDRRSLRLAETTLPEIPGIRAHDRSLSGANPMHDQNLYQVLYALTKITGEPRYAREADRTLAWFFEHCQSEETGLLAWGEHLFWDFRREQAATVRGPELIHEFYRPWVLWPRSFELAPRACGRFADGLWKHQIADHERGLFSRHAEYRTHRPGTGYEFPRHGGFYIATWAHAYRHSGEARYLQSIERLADSFAARRHPVTKALPAETRTPELCWPSSDLSLAIDLTHAAALVPDPLAAKLRAQARTADDVFLRLGHDLSPTGPGFVSAVFTSTLKPGRARNGHGRPPYTRTWATGYGQATDAQTALLCHERYRQTETEGYRTLILATANRYLESEPDADVVLYPGALAKAIELLNVAHRLTDDARYRRRAEHFAALAVRVFFPDGALPRASSRHDHYEAITGGDTLAMVLLNHWAAQHRPELDLGLHWSDR